MIRIERGNDVLGIEVGNTFEDTTKLTDVAWSYYQTSKKEQFKERFGEEVDWVGVDDDEIEVVCGWNSAGLREGDRFSDRHEMFNLAWDYWSECLEHWFNDEFAELEYEEVKN